MFEIKFGENEEIVVSGRFDASQADEAMAVFDALTEPSIVDLRNLDYISSKGLAILLKTQKRLKASSGDGLKLVNVNPHINDIFRYSGFNQVFEIETTRGEVTVTLNGAQRDNSMRWYLEFEGNDPDVEFKETPF